MLPPHIRGSPYRLVHFSLPFHNFLHKKKPFQISYPKGLLLFRIYLFLPSVSQNHLADTMLCDSNRYTLCFAVSVRCFPLINSISLANLQINRFSGCLYNICRPLCPPTVICLIVANGTSSYISAAGIVKPLYLNLFDMVIPPVFNLILLSEQKIAHQTLP